MSHDTELLRTYAALWTKRFRTENASTTKHESKKWIHFLHALYETSRKSYQHRVKSALLLKQQQEQQKQHSEDASADMIAAHSSSATPNSSFTNASSLPRSFNQIPTLAGFKQATYGTTISENETIIDVIELDKIGVVTDEDITLSSVSDAHETY